MYEYTLNQSPCVFGKYKDWTKFLKPGNLKTCGSKSDNTRIMKLACLGNIKHWALDVTKENESLLLMFMC